MSDINPVSFEIISKGKKAAEWMINNKDDYVDNLQDILNYVKCLKSTSMPELSRVAWQEAYNHGSTEGALNAKQVCASMLAHIFSSDFQSGFDSFSKALIQEDQLSLSNLTRLPPLDTKVSATEEEAFSFWWCSEKKFGPSLSMYDSVLELVRTRRCLDDGDDYVLSYWDTWKRAVANHAQSTLMIEPNEEEVQAYEEWRNKEDAFPVLDGEHCITIDKATETIKQLRNQIALLSSNILRETLKDFMEHGCRHDINPTIKMSMTGKEAISWALNRFKSMDEYIRNKAREVLAQVDTLQKDRSCNSECGMRMRYNVSCSKHDCQYITNVQVDKKEDEQ